MHRHQHVIFADFADAWPLGVPSVSSVIGVGTFREAVKGPALLRCAHADDERFMIPAYTPNWIGGGVGVAVDSTWPRDLGELITANDFPSI